MEVVLRSDFLMWAVMKVAPEEMASFIGVSKDLQPPRLSLQSPGRHRGRSDRSCRDQRLERTGPEAPPGPGPWIGAVRYRQIAEAMQGGFTRYWDRNAAVPWLYNARTRNWITYDDPESLALKADLVRERGLGGIMIWELSGDDGTLLPAIHRRLHPRS